MTILITGAAGSIGTMLRAGLPPLGHRLRLLDRVPIPGAASIVADVADPAAIAEAVRGVESIVHLAGTTREAPFDDILANNMVGTQRVYAAALGAGVKRIIYAGSNHAIGFAERAPPEAPLPVETRLRPDTFYGLSKCFGENLATLYADKHGIATITLRIGSCFARPQTVRMLSTWLSPGDCVRLFHAALTTSTTGHVIAYGISANARAWWNLSSARALGYAPQDDAEAFAPEVLAACGALAPDDPEYRYAGGSFTRIHP